MKLIRKAYSVDAVQYDGSMKSLAPLELNAWKEIQITPSGGLLLDISGSRDFKVVCWGDWVYRDARGVLNFMTNKTKTELYDEA